jgi:hypothetical protein
MVFYSFSLIPCSKSKSIVSYEGNSKNSQHAGGFAMAARLISFQTKNENKSVRFCVAKYKNERKYNEEKSLGRVIDDGKGIFKNRERSLFSFPVGNCYDLALKEIACTSAKIASGTMKTVLDFGDSFFLHTYLQTPPYWDVFQRVTGKKRQRYCSLSFVWYSILNGGAGCHAKIWCEGNYSALESARIQPEYLVQARKRVGGNYR